jgi:hypothetical protein
MTNSAYSDKKQNSQSTCTTCTHCEGIFEHESWCATRDPRMAYAYQIVADATKITAGDALILHSLGVAWGQAV